MFAVALGIVANLAWATALGTGGPWFSTGISVQVYSVTMVAAMIVAMGLATVATSRTGHFDDVLRALELKIAAGRDANEAQAMEPSRVLGPDVDQQIDDLLVGIDRFQPTMAVEAARLEHDTPFRVAGPNVARSVPVASEVFRELLRQKLSLTAARNRVWPVVAGPIVVSIVFIAISGAMLPGAEEFAASHYQLNTTFILFLGYGWFILLAWAVASLALLAGRTPEPKV